MGAEAIASQILAEAIKVGGATWTKIEKTAPLYVRGYARSLEDIAAGVVSGEISKADARMFVANAKLLLVMGIANTSQIILAQVQSFMNGVIKTLKTAINASLPVAIL